MKRRLTFVDLFILSRLPSLFFHVAKLDPCSHNDCMGMRRILVRGGGSKLSLRDKNCKIDIRLKLSSSTHMRRSLLNALPASCVLFVGFGHLPIVSGSILELLS